MLIVRLAETTGVYTYLAIRAGQVARGRPLGVVIALAGATALLSAELAEIFIHHRVLVIPVVDDARVRGLVTRTDFFRALAERLR